MSRSRTRRFLAAFAVAAGAVGTVAACSSDNSSDENAPLRIVASSVPHAEILKFVEEKGLLGDTKIEVSEITGDLDANEVLEAGDTDANFFQHVPYQESWSKEKGVDDLVAVVSVAWAEGAPGAGPEQAVTLVDGVVEAYRRENDWRKPGSGMLNDLIARWRLDPARCLQAKAEAEIAFVLGADLPSPDTAVEQVAAAVASVNAAIEIVDSRIADWRITFADTVADNGSSAFFVLAEQGLPLAGLDLAGATMAMTLNGTVASTGIGAAALGNPLNAAAWLARTLAAAGEPLKAGDVLLAGALGPMVALMPGDEVRTEIAGIGACSFTFAGA